MKIGDCTESEFGLTFPICYAFFEDWGWHFTVTNAI